VAKLPDITLVRSKVGITGICSGCGHEVEHAEKKVVVQRMYGHLAGRHKGNIAELISGAANVIDRT
jgi:hypothetical protein